MAAYSDRSIREAIAKRITERCKITAFAYDIDSVVYPRAIVLAGPEGTDYHSDVGSGYVRSQYLVEVKTSAGDPVDAQIALSDFASTGIDRSIIDALEEIASGSSTPTLAGAVSMIVVNGVTFTTGQQRDNGPFEFAATFTLTIIAPRS